MLALPPWSPCFPDPTPFSPRPYLSHDSPVAAEFGLGTRRGGMRFLVAFVVVLASASAIRIAPEMGGDLSISMNIDIQHAEDTVTTDLAMPCDIGHSLTPEVR